MFAFVVHDQCRKRLWAARDRLGKKPLFYAVLGDHLHVASEIKALRKSPMWVGEIDEGTVDAYLALGYIPAPRTIYRGVLKLPPAHRSASMRADWRSIGTGTSPSSMSMTARKMTFWTNWTAA